MGTTVSTIHVYSSAPIPEAFGAFRSFSDGWQTRNPAQDSVCDFDADRRLARRISGQLPYPVLWFWELDGDEFGLTLFVNGKQVTMFRTEYGYEPKGLYKLPPLIGYPEGNKKRFSRILSCTDLTDTIAMLEEYLGVCLEVFEDLLETPSELRRERDDRLYRAWLVEEKRLAGKHAPIQLELVEEIFGLVEHRAVWDIFLPERRHIFYLAQFHTLTDRREPLPAVEFRDGKLIPADDDVVSSAEYGMFNAPQDPRFQLQFYPQRERFPLRSFARRLIEGGSLTPYREVMIRAILTSAAI